MCVAITLVAVDVLQRHMYVSRHISSKERTMKHGSVLLQLQKKILSEAFILFKKAFSRATASFSVSRVCLKVHVS